jgi:hypothetical protein
MYGILVYTDMKAGRGEKPPNPVSNLGDIV